MRLLADESCDFEIVRALRAASYDVASILETQPGSSDEQVIELAKNHQRLLLTEDKDFGQLVFAAAKDHAGVILIRYPAAARSTLAAELLKMLDEHGGKLYRAFVTLEPGRIRLSRAP